MLIRTNRLREPAQFQRTPRQGWLLITRRWVIATGFLAHVYA